MSTVIEVCFCFLVLALFAGNSFAQSFSDTGLNDDTLSGINKRGWSMLSSSGLANRQLPMLRVGRSDSNRLTSDQLHALLASLLDEPRDETRRQPPLPRYGRSGGAFSFEDFISNLQMPNGGLPPAPRGGRYKRAVGTADDSSYSLGDFLLQNDANSNRLRAVTKPRVGRYLVGGGRNQVMAVPRPRYGRQQLQGDQSVDSSSSNSNSDNSS